MKKILFILLTFCSVYNQAQGQVSVEEIDAIAQIFEGISPDADQFNKKLLNSGKTLDELYTEHQDTIFSRFKEGFSEQFGNIFEYFDAQNDKTELETYNYKIDEVTQDHAVYFEKIVRPKINGIVKTYRDTLFNVYLPEFGSIKAKDSVITIVSNFALEEYMIVFKQYVRQRLAEMAGTAKPKPKPQLSSLEKAQEALRNKDFVNAESFAIKALDDEAEATVYQLLWIIYDTNYESIKDIDKNRAKAIKKQRDKYKKWKPDD